jgi:hypothetical protein
VHSANHVQDTGGDSFISTQQNEVSQAVPQLTSTPDQCQQLLSLLQHQSATFHTSSSANMAGSIRASSSTPSASTSSQVSSPISSLFNLNPRYSVFFFSASHPKPSIFNSYRTPWIIDIGAI